METNNRKQLVTQDNGNIEKIFPKNYMSNIVDEETGESLRIFLLKYNHIDLGYRSSKSSARLAVPIIMRRKGLYITYYLPDDVVITEFFNGNKTEVSDTNWVKDELWVKDVNELNIYDVKISDGSITLDKLSEEVMQLISKGDITINNFPDNEDLELYTIYQDSNNKIDAIRFKDRDNSNGMAYKHLRKTKNMILSQSDFNQVNTIYEIRYDFDLNGNTINIPDGCILKFEGGTIINGNLKGNLLNEYLKPEWFGAKGDGITNDSIAFQCCLNLKPSKIILTSNYLIKNITIFDNISFIGLGNPSIIAIKQQNCEDVAEQIFNSILPIKYIEFHNIHFNGNYSNPTIGAIEGNAVSNIFIDNCDKVIISNCLISKFVASYNYISTLILKDRIYPAVFCIRNYKEVIVYNNEITDNPDKEVIYLLAKDNKSKAIIHDNYCHNNLKSYSSFYIFDGSAHIYNNKIGDCRTSAIGCICKNSIIENNYIYNYQRRGINCSESMIQADNTVIKNNILTNKGYLEESDITEVIQGIVIYGSNILVEGNKIDGAYTGINVWESTDINYFNNNPWLDSSFKDFYNLNINNNIVEAIANPIKGRNRTKSQTGYNYNIRWYNIKIINNTFEVKNITSNIAGSSIYFDNIENVLISNNIFNGWGKVQGGRMTSQPGAISSEYYVKNITISDNIFNGKNENFTYFSFINAIQNAESINGISVINNSDDFNMISNLTTVRIIPNIPSIDYIIYESDKTVSSSIISSTSEVIRKIINGLIYIKRINQQKRYNGLRIFDPEINQICIWENNAWRNEDYTLIDKVSIISDISRMIFPNMIYKIVKDIDLQGKTLTLQANCTLDFQGGSFSNGTIVGSNTKIESGLTKIFGTDITLSGTWIADSLSPEHFGTTGVDATQDTTYIQKALDCCAAINIKTVKLQNKIYQINSSLLIQSNIKLEGATSRVWNNGSATILSLAENVVGITVESTEVEINDLKITGNATNTGISFTNRSYYFSGNKIITTGLGIGFDIQSSWTYIFNLCRIEGGTIGFKIQEGTSGTFNSCVAFSCLEYGFYVTKLNYGSFNGCGTDGCKYGFYFTDACRGVTLSSCGCENTQVGGYMVKCGARAYVTITGFSVGTVADVDCDLFIFEANCRVSLIDLNVSSLYHPIGNTLNVASGAAVALINCYLTGTSVGLENCSVISPYGNTLKYSTTVDKINTKELITSSLATNATYTVLPTAPLNSVYLITAVTKGNSAARGLAIVTIPTDYGMATVDNLVANANCQISIDATGNIIATNTSSSAKVYKVSLLKLI